MIRENKKLQLYRNPQSPSQPAEHGETKKELWSVAPDTKDVGRAEMNASEAPGAGIPRPEDSFSYVDCVHLLPAEITQISCMKRKISLQYW